MFERYSYKTLKELVNLYEFLIDNLTSHSDLDDLRESLDSSIFYLGSILYPDALCVPDIIELVKGCETNEF